jgi:hypothetical protein
MKHIIIALVLAMFLIGCGNNSTSAENSNPPFTLHQVGALKKQTSAIKVIQPMSEQVYDFDLDTVATTTSFYFIPANSSTSAITGMKLTFDNPKFVVSPDTITTLSAPDKNTGVTPLIKVTVVHGKEALGIGYDDMLSANQYGTLTISGENDDGKFSVNYTMHVYAKRMVITIKYDSIVVKDIASNGSTEVIPLFYAEFDSSSAGCYIDVDGQIITSNTRMIRYSDLAANLDVFIGRGIDENLKAEFDDYLKRGIIASKLFEASEFNVYSVISGSTLVFRIILREAEDEIIQITYSTALGVTID